MKNNLNPGNSNQVSLNAASMPNTSLINCVLTSWDNNWNDNVFGGTWTGDSAGDPWVQGPYTVPNAQPWYPNTVPGYPTINPNPNMLPNQCLPNYEFNFKPFIPMISKAKGKCDILAGFFNQDLHALVVMGEDGGARFVPFMDKFGMIWMQESLTNWAAYDREKFMKFVENEDAAIFIDTPLSKDEVLRHFHTPDK